MARRLALKYNIKFYVYIYMIFVITYWLKHVGVLKYIINIRKMHLLEVVICNKTLAYLGLL
jgi:hypothetical protein